MYRKLGFSLIELMVVIFIIALLAALAIPLYGNYTKRSKIGSAIAQLSPAKAEVSEMILNEKKIYEDLDHYASKEIELPYGVQIIENAVISIHLSFVYPNDGFAVNDIIILTPTIATGVINWSCGYHGSTLTASNTPPVCQESLDVAQNNNAPQPYEESFPVIITIGETDHNASVACIPPDQPCTVVTLDGDAWLAQYVKSNGWVILYKENSNESYTVYDISDLSVIGDSALRNFVEQSISEWNK